MKWYVIRVANGKEKKVKESIEHELKRFSIESIISEILIPSKKIDQLRNNKRIKVEKITYPGYIFIECESIKDVEGHVKYIAGVQTVLKSPLSQVEIDRIQEKKTEVIIEDNFFVNEIIKIIDGPFKTFIGTIKSLEHKKQRAKISVTIFDRETLVDLDYSQFIKDYN